MAGFLRKKNGKISFKKLAVLAIFVSVAVSLAVTVISTIIGTLIARNIKKQNEPDEQSLSEEEVNEVNQDNTD